MGKVQHAHDPKYRGETHRNQEQEHAPRQTVEDVGQDTFQDNPSLQKETEVAGAPISSCSRFLPPRG